jgi:hypothetical protein
MQDSGETRIRGLNAFNYYAPLKALSTSSESEIATRPELA